MRLFNQCVFDSYVSGTASTYSDPQFDQMLGAAEKLVLQAVVDQVTAGTSPTLSVQVEHSADRRNWKAKNGSAEIATTAGALTIGAAASQQAVGADTGTNPGLGFSRINITMGAAGGVPGSRLRIFATGRAENLY